MRTPDSQRFGTDSGLLARVGLTGSGVVSNGTARLWTLKFLAEQDDVEGGDAERTRRAGLREPDIYAWERASQQVQQGKKMEEVRCSPGGLGISIVWILDEWSRLAGACIAVCSAVI